MIRRFKRQINIEQFLNSTVHTEDNLLCKNVDFVISKWGTSVGIPPWLQINYAW